jgi:hypothetical protein
VRPDLVVIVGITLQDPTQVSLAQDDEVIETLAPDRADQSLRVPILPWRPGRGRLVPNTCPFRKSYPDILVMQSPQDWHYSDLADPLDRSPQWCILPK